MTVKSTAIAEAAKPGQFLNIRGRDSMDVLLRHPMSILRAGKGNLEILFKVVGKGTDQLSRYRTGEQMDIIGPLGNGFDLGGVDRKSVLVAGGTGVASLFFLAEELARRKKEMIVLLGARTGKELLCAGDLRKFTEVKIATEDGSKGMRGMVTGLLEQEISGCGSVFSCGPRPMLKKVAEVSRKNHVSCQVSLEELMGCGVGACLSCACKVKSNGGFEYQRVCAEGPVFNAGELIWE